MKLVRVFVLAALLAIASGAAISATSPEAGNKNGTFPIWCCWPEQ